MKNRRSNILSLFVLISPTLVNGWTTRTPISQRSFVGVSRFSRSQILFQSESNEGEDIQRTSFDDAGKSLIEEEDQKRLEMMGDFDSTGSDQNANAERMRAAIRARAAGLNIEKSQETADLIARKEEEARMAGPPGAQRDDNSFGGLDLSQISDTKMKNTASDWNEEMPTVLFDPADEMTQEEREEADPLMLKGPVDQAVYEIQQTNWPTPLAALREVLVMLGVIGFSALFIVGLDNLLRDFYTNTAGFIPSKEALANYAARFDGLDLPQGWMDNMNEQDIQQFSEKVNSVGGGGLPDL